MAWALAPPGETNATLTFYLGGGRGRICRNEQPNARFPVCRGPEMPPCKSDSAGSGFGLPIPERWPETMVIWSKLRVCRWWSPV